MSRMDSYSEKIPACIIESLAGEGRDDKNERVPMASLRSEKQGRVASNKLSDIDKVASIKSSSM